MKYYGIDLFVLTLEYPVLQISKLSLTGARKSFECDKVLEFVTRFCKLKKKSQYGF